ncbi:MAG: UDP-glucose/GDP-mannose dehydrogenase family protein, partial [Actinobacteria bacterium]|nr:UDP-glucose/GDP-mannose dehydrogenase family protein [Actinomycetota bacterium]
MGTGYVGLTTGACLAHLGHTVVCADIDESKVTDLRAGRIPIVENGLEQLVADGLASGRLSFVVGGATAVTECDIAFLCVPTPQGDDGSADLSYVQQAAEQIAPHLPHEAIVVNKSTVPVGSTKVVERALKRPDIRVVSNPEFLREGSAVQDFLKPDRVVVGADDQAAALKVASLYDGLTTRVIITDPASAETIKYAANAFLATKLSFINAIAAICEGVGADINDVVVGMGSDKRIGESFLRPGPGWGGSCFPKDSRALIKIAEEAGYDFELLDGVIAVNDQQFDRVAAKVRLAAGLDADRQAPALEVGEGLDRRVGRHEQVVGDVEHREERADARLRHAVLAQHLLGVARARARDLRRAALEQDHVLGRAARARARLHARDVLVEQRRE